MKYDFGGNKSTGLIITFGFRSQLRIMLILYQIWVYMLGHIGQYRQQQIKQIYISTYITSTYNFLEKIQIEMYAQKRNECLKFDDMTKRCTVL